MDTWLLAVDCVINLGILGWLVWEHKHAPETKVVMRVSGVEIETRWDEPTRIRVDL